MTTRIRAKYIRTTNGAEGDGNMQIHNFHMYHIVSCQESFKRYSGHGRSLLKYTLGAAGVFQNIL